MPELITMLTHNDVTAPNSIELFMGAKDAPCNYWGFKDIGISEDEMKRLVDAMKENGNTVFMESLAYSEKNTMESLELASRCGVEYVLGATYYENAAAFASAYHIRFSPFIGLRNSGRLYGDIEELVFYAKERVKHDVFGINISAYRYEGDCGELIQRVVAAVDKPVSVAGSVDCFEKLASIKASGCWAFTVGGALFEHKFGDTFANQIEIITQFLNDAS